MFLIFSLFSLFLSFNIAFSLPRVDVISDWNINDIQINWQDRDFFGCDLVQHWDVNAYVRSKQFETAKKVICMNDIGSADLLAQIPKEKLVMFFWEPIGKFHERIHFFSKVYTHNDRQVDAGICDKLYYPFLVPVQEPIVPFEDKKMATLITFHWTSDREQVIYFYNNKPLGELEFYGYDPGIFKDHPMYKGKIPGYHSGSQKNEVLRQYRFCYCYENCQIPGYITEKIFAVFKAGSVPIYYGAQNIESYIHSNCYIDFRKFRNHEELYQYLKNMDESEYNNYINNIKEFVKSGDGYFFTPKSFMEFLNKVIWEN